MDWPNFLMLMVFVGEFLLAASMEYAGVNKTIKFERVNNVLGKTLIYYDQEFVPTSNMKSYSVTNLLKCRYIKNVTQTSNRPLNIISVGEDKNGTINCNIDYFEETKLFGLQLRPKAGMFTFFTMHYDSYYPAKNGIFIWYIKSFDIANFNVDVDRCSSDYGSQWHFPFAITADQYNMLLQYMMDMKMDKVPVGASCSTRKWFDGSNFTYPIEYINDNPTAPRMYFDISDKKFHCTWSINIYWICMCNIFSPSWSEI